jgi:outer membrane protein assembly factor BamB
MQKFKNKKTASIALILLLTISMSIAIFSTTVQAANQIPTYLFIRAEPDPVGIGQPIYLNLFLSKPTATAGMGSTGDLYTGLTVTITAPDGTNTTMGPYTADATGGVGGLSFTPTVTGNYSFQGFYPGQTLKTAGTYNGTIELPSMSTSDTVTVQQDPILTYSSPPLPTEYWARPIYATNYAWATLGGSWFGLGVPSFATTGGYDAAGNFNAYTQAPNTAHVMWTKPTAFGGQTGNPIPGDQESQYVSTTIMSNFFEPLVIDGVLYYSDYPILNSNAASWNAVDLRTGQTLWSELPGTQATIPGASTAEKLRMGQTVKFHSMQEYGSFSLLYSTGGANSSFKLYEPFSGEYVGNITNTVSSSYIMDENPNDQNVGSIFGYYVANGNLTFWNSSLCFNGGTAAQETFRPPTTVNYTKGDQWNVTLPTTLNGLTISPALSISRVTSDVILLRSAPNIVTQSSAGYAVEAGYDALTGAQLWITNRTIPMYQSMSVLCARDDIFVTHNQDTDEAYGFNLKTGGQLWGPVALKGNAISVLQRGADIAYGRVYIYDFGGYVNALNATTGQLLWTYTPPSEGYNSPYGVAPIWSFGTPSIADGKLFFSASHMYDPPMFTGAKRLAINCTDGSLIWSIMSFDGRAPGAIADGFLVTWNSFDKQIYTYGKGQTAITASIQNDIVPSGNDVMIKGTVTDQSPGTQQSTQKADFPAGVPCVSDASMTDWMEYVYMQQPKPANATGVPVTLSVIDANGNFRQIGQTTSDANGFYSYQWTPDIAGKYTVMASFGGSESYWPSQTETAFSVKEAAPTPTPSPVAQQSVADQYFIPAIAGLFVAIIVVGAVMAILMLRKRP